MQYPKVIFRSDLGGIKLSKGMAIKYSRIQHSKGFPDLFVYYPSKGYAGLAIELKAKNIYKKNGELLSSEHLQAQKSVLDYLSSNKYLAKFAVGFDQAKLIIDTYLC